MPKPLEELPSHPLSAGTSYSQPHRMPLITHLNDDAITAMVDFKQDNFFTVEANTSLPEAEIVMRACRTHVLLVVDKLDHIIGVLTTEDILGEKPLNVSRDRFIKRDAITVRMLMTPQEKLLVLSIEDVKLAKVGDIVMTLHRLKQHDTLVVEINPDTKDQEACGLFSLSQISKQLGMDVLSGDLSEAKTLSELQTQLKGT